MNEPERLPNFEPSIVEISEAMAAFDEELGPIPAEIEDGFQSTALEKKAQDNALYFKDHKWERDEDEDSAYESIRQAHVLANYVLKMSARGKDEARAVTGTIYRHDAYIDQSSVTIVTNLELKENHTGIAIDMILIPGKFGTLKRLGRDHKRPEMNVVVTHRDGQPIRTSDRYKRFKEFPATKMYEK